MASPRSDNSIAELRRKKSIDQSLSYIWSKEIIEMAQEQSATTPVGARGSAGLRGCGKA
jgi:hypothetical protein